jgi:hypothetical protein
MKSRREIWACAFRSTLLPSPKRSRVETSGSSAGRFGFAQAGVGEHDFALAKSVRGQRLAASKKPFTLPPCDSHRRRSRASPRDRGGKSSPRRGEEKLNLMRAFTVGNDCRGRRRGEEKERQEKEERGGRARYCACATRLVTGSICIRPSMRFRSRWNSASSRP